MKFKFGIKHCCLLSKKEEDDDVDDGMFNVH